MQPLKKLKEILTGWKNYLSNNQEVKPEADRRMSICNTCPLQVKGICSKHETRRTVTTFVYQGEIRQIDKIYRGCGCPLKAKVANPDSHCPLGKF